VNYRLFYSQDLLDWLPLGTTFPGTGQAVPTEAPMLNDRGFIQIQVIP
jgi:hypothetical protein